MSRHDADVALVFVKLDSIMSFNFSVRGSLIRWKSGHNAFIIDFVRITTYPRHSGAMVLWRINNSRMVKHRGPRIYSQYALALRVVRELE